MPVAVNFKGSSLKSVVKDFSSSMRDYYFVQHLLWDYSLFAQDIPGAALDLIFFCLGIALKMLIDNIFRGDNEALFH